MPTLKLAVQRIDTDTPAPANALIKTWITAALVGRYNKPAELVIRIVGETESAELNQTYRHRTGPTNVLSFPFTAPPPVQTALLGDLVICAPLVVKEATEQHKELFTHWAHLVIHGVLHLLGYDHQTETTALAMEQLEQQILHALGYPNPYDESGALLS